MVLKNSNSRLNSGATQRNIKGNCLKAYMQKYLETEEECLFMSFWGDTYTQIEINDTLKECLNKIYYYLGWEGLKLVYSVPRNLTGWKSETCFCTNKRQMWNIPERIKTLMADADFLESVTANINIKVEQIQIIPFKIKTGKGNNVKARNLVSSSEVTAKSSLEKSEQESTPRRRHTYHGRGVQRPHLWKRTLKCEENNPKDEQRRSERKLSSVELNITVYGSFHTDARCGRTINKYDRLQRLGHTLKSFRKSKSSVNGRLAYRKGYTRKNIEEDLDCTFDEIHESVYLFDTATCELEAELESEIQTSAHSSRYYMLSDFIKERSVQQKNKRKHRTSNAPMEKGENTQFKERSIHPKGSYSIVPRDQSVSVQTDNNCEITDSNQTKVLADPNVKKSATAHSVTNIEETENAFKKSDSKIQAHVHGQEKQFQNNMKTFNDSFMRVNLLLQEEKVSSIPLSCGLADKQVKLTGGHNILVAHSLPPCFIVELNEHKRGAKEKPYILLKKTGTSSTAWFLSVQGTQPLQSQRKERLQKLLEDEWHTGTSLTKLIETVENLKEDSDTNKGRDDVVCTTLSPKARATRSDTIWQSLSHTLIPQEAFVGTLDEALSHLQILRGGMHACESSQNSVEAFDLPKWPEKYTLDSKECGICFLPCTFIEAENESALTLLPCMHFFCVSCWRAHVYHSIRQGIFEISCMESNCTTKLDKVSAMGILPYDFIISWQTLLKERRVDASAASTRCPNSGCQYVAVLPRKSQFGTLVRCNCQHYWCGGCQSVPHWPASCDQMAVYRKLLYKKGETPTSTTDFFVKVKKCPKCRHPIEKSTGCPHMRCGMCQTLFCWICLNFLPGHRIENCKENDNDFKMFNLQNKLVYELPMKHLADCFLVNQRLKSIHNTSNWFGYLDKIRDGVYKPPRHLYYLADCKIVVKHLVDVVEQCLLFLKQAYTLLESFYVLLCFARLTRRKSDKFFLAFTISSMSQLNFIADRLNVLVIGKSLCQIRKVDKRVSILMEAGKKVLYQVTSVVPALQHLSRDVETEWVGNLDISKYLRYK